MVRQTPGSSGVTSSRPSWLRQNLTAARRPTYQILLQRVRVGHRPRDLDRPPSSNVAKLAAPASAPTGRTVEPVRSGDHKPRPTPAIVLNGFAP